MIVSFFYLQTVIAEKKMLKVLCKKELWIKKKNRNFPPLLINGWEDTALIKSLMKLTANNLRKSSWMKDYCCFCYRTYQIWHQINFSSGYECHNILRTEIRITMWTQMSSNRFFFFSLLFELCRNNHCQNVAKSDGRWRCKITIFL